MLNSIEENVNNNVDEPKKSLNSLLKNINVYKVSLIYWPLDP